MMPSFPTNKNSIYYEIEPPPQLVIHVNDNNLGLLGYLVIDSVASGISCGGIRMAHDISLNEVTHLARAMTLKYAFINSYVGGAKAGIICPLDATHKEKTEILKAFGRNLSPILGTVFGGGGDLGIGPEELDVIKKAAGIVTELSPGAYKAGFFAAYGVFVSIKIVIRELRLKLNESTFAIEGYGNVGRALARLLYQGGGKIVAISTIDGAIFNGKGLDIDRLEDLATRYGDRAVEVYEHAEKIEKADLLTLKVDIVIPAARAWSINIDNVCDVKANAIVSAANIPVTKDAAEVLYRKGVIYIPDFVSTSGTIMGWNLLDRGYEENYILDIMGEIFQVKVSKLMKLSNHNGMSIEQLALKITYSNLERQRDNATLRKNRVKWVIAKVKEEKSMITLLEIVAGRLYEKASGPNLFLRDILKPLAVANVYRNLLGDVRYYPTLAVGE